MHNLLAHLGAKAMTKQERHELQCVYWELAVAWKLYDTAIRDQRFEDANYYAKQREVAENRARQLLDFKEKQQ